MKSGDINDAPFVRAGADRFEQSADEKLMNAQTTSPGNYRFPLPFLLFGAFCLAVTSAFILLHVRTPSDGARLADQPPVYLAEGIRVTVYAARPDGLRTGDLVIEVAGRPVEAWVRGVLGGDTARVFDTLGQQIEYKVLRDGQPVSLMVTLIPLPVTTIVSRHAGVLLFAFISQGLAAFVLLRRPQDPAARALFIWAFSGSHTYAWSFALQLSDFVDGTGFWIYHLATPGLWLMYWAASLHVALVFPRPLRFVKRLPWLVPAVYLAAFVFYLSIIAGQRLQTASSLTWLSTWGPASNLAAVIFLTLTCLLVGVQYLRNRGTEAGRQIRWAVFGVAVSGGGGLILYLAAPILLGRSLISVNTLGLLVLPFPISLAIAIWRHQLFDIDLIINRALVYSLLTGTLAVVYSISVILLQLVFPVRSQTSVVLSTLAIAALFNPLRGRIQNDIDRLFYRKKYDAQRILDTFNLAARDEVDIERLSSRLLNVIDDSMQPEKVHLWLKTPGPSRYQINTGERQDSLQNSEKK